MNHSTKEKQKLFFFFFEKCRINQEAAKLWTSTSNAPRKSATAAATSTSRPTINGLFSRNEPAFNSSKYNRTAAATTTIHICQNESKGIFCTWKRVRMSKCPIQSHNIASKYRYGRWQWWKPMVQYNIQKMIIKINSDESESFTEQQQQQNQIQKITREASVTKFDWSKHSFTNFAINDVNRMQSNHSHGNEKQKIELWR